MATHLRSMRFLSYLLRGVIGIALLTSATASGLVASTEDVDCIYESPLLLQRFDQPLMVTNPNPLGEWRLPLSALRPDILTEARVSSQLRQNQSTGKWSADFVISFPDPKPYGIPFSFRKVEIQWQGDDGAHTVLLDWSDQCTNPGRSLFPGQRWSFSVGLGETVQSLEFRLWGSRN